MVDVGAVNALIQQRMLSLGLAETTAVDAAGWLDKAGVLGDSPTRPGLPLRKLLRDGLIEHAFQLPNKRWYITRGAASFDEAKNGASFPVISAPKVSGPSPVETSPEAPVATFDRPGLAAAGFEGFVPFRGITRDAVPAEQGVYVVLREKDTRPHFLEHNPGGRFKGKDPTVAPSELENEWPEGAHCVYIGKAGRGSTGSRGLSKRIDEFRRFGDGEAIGHSGGRRIWQLDDADDFVIAWKRTPASDPENVEAGLLQLFRARHGRLPIGNRTAGRRQT
jgi:hypothetical protein